MLREFDRGSCVFTVTLQQVKQNNCCLILPFHAAHDERIQLACTYKFLFLFCIFSSTYHLLVFVHVYKNLQQIELETVSATLCRNNRVLRQKSAEYTAIRFITTQGHCTVLFVLVNIIRETHI